MVRRIIKYIFICVLIFLAFLCIKSISLKRRYFMANKDYQILAGQKNITLKDARKLCEEYDYCEGCYTVYEDEMVQNECGTEEELSVVYKNFDSFIVFDSFNVLYKDDYSGCLLDEETMYKLFGTQMYTGQTVCYDGREYIVRGIVKCNVPVLVINYPDNSYYDGSMISGIVLDTSDEVYMNQFSSSLEASYGVAEAVYYTDEYDSLRRWTELPVKWSDFDFWPDYWQGIKDKINHVIYDNKDVIERLVIKNNIDYLFIYLGFGLIVLLLFVFSFKSLKVYIKNSRKKWLLGGRPNA